MSHIVSECSVLVQREYKRRHDNVARYLHLQLYEEYKLLNPDKWCEHKPDGVSANNNCKILWDVIIQCDKEIQARRWDIVVMEQAQKRSCC